uniref:Uncharacterized protein n=1 Tax=Fusarium oxysporum (strain Fo5176) TaxID=660025 RepID=A0A0D2XLE4_FUSOF
MAVVVVENVADDIVMDVDLSDTAGVESGEVDETGDVDVTENADSEEAVDDKYVSLGSGIENRRGGDDIANAVSPFGDGIPHGSLRYFDEESSGVPVSSFATLTPLTKTRTLSPELAFVSFWISVILEVKCLRQWYKSLGMYRQELRMSRSNFQLTG